MRNTLLVLALVAMTALLAQPASSYRITHTYTLGGDGRWDYIVPDPLESPSVHRPPESRDGGRRRQGDAARRSHRHRRRARDRAGARHGPWIRHLGQRPVRGHVRSEDLQGARPDPRRRRCRRHPLRPRIESRLHLEWRRALVDRDRPGGGDPDHEHSARRQAGIRRVRRRRQGVRKSHRHERGGGDRRQDGDRVCGAGPPPRASSPSPWPSTPCTTGSSADAAAA